MKKFLVRHEAVIGVRRDEGATHRAIELTFFSIVDAPNVEEANDKIVAYSDPNFRTKIADVIELGDSVSAAELYDLMAHTKVLKEQD